MKTTIHTTMKTIMKLAAVMLAMCISSGVYAQKVYYASKAGGEWSDPTTWSLSETSPETPSVPPSENDEVVISLPVTISSTTVAKAAKVDIHTRASLIIEKNDNIPVFHQFIGAGQLILEGDCYPVVDNNKDSYSGNVKFDATKLDFALTRNIPNYKNLKVTIGGGNVSFSNANLKFDEIRVNIGKLIATKNFAVVEDIIVNTDATLEGKNDVVISANKDIVNSGTVNVAGTLAMVSTTQNQNITLKSGTSINNLTINKGAYSAFLIAEATNLLTLGSNNPINLQSGTLSIGSNIEISKLANGDFAIPQNAKLQIAGGSVSTTNNIIVNGELALGNVNGSSGILNGKTITLNNGGKVSLYQGEATIENLSAAANVEGCTFYQEGGTLTAPNINIASPNATYTVKGGTMYVQNYFVNTTLGAISGGHTIINKDGANINTKKDFWDLTINQNINLNQDLTVLSNLTVANGVTVGLNGSAKNLIVGGNFTIGNNASFNFQDGSLITLNGNRDAYVTIPSTFNPTALKIDKSAGKSVILNGNVTLANGKDLEIASGILNTGANSITVSGNVVNNGEMIGTLNINGDAKEISGTGEYGTIVQNVTTVNLGSNITANTYTFNDGKCYLNAHVIKLHEVTNGGPAHFFVNNGDKASAGLCLLVNGGNYSATDVVATWPIGTSTYYAPASITAKETATFVSEYITIGAVGKQHPCLKTSSGQNLPCYWAVKTEEKNTCSFILKFEFNGIINEAYSALALVHPINEDEKWVETSELYPHSGTTTQSVIDPNCTGSVYSSYYYKDGNKYRQFDNTIYYSSGTGGIDYYRKYWNSYTKLGTIYKNPTYINSQVPYTSYGVDNNALYFHNCTESPSLTTGDYTAGFKNNSTELTIWYSSLPNDGKKDELYTHSRDNGKHFNWYKAGSNVRSGSPQAGDIAVIVGYDFINIEQASGIEGVGKVIFMPEGSERGRLRLHADNNNFGVLEGEGIVQFIGNNSFTNYLGDCDVSSFDQEENSFYWFTPGKSGMDVTLNHTGTFPNVCFETNNNGGTWTVSYGADLDIRGTLQLRANETFKVTHDINCGNILLGGWGGAKMQFQNGNTNTVYVRGNIYFDGSNENSEKSISVTSGNSTNRNTLIVDGNIVSSYSNSGEGLKLVNGSQYVILEFSGDKNASVQIKNPNNFTFNVKQMLISKEPGSSITLSDKKVTFVDGLGANDTENKTLVLKSGEVIFDVNGQIVPLSTGGQDFVIPENATLTANKGVTLNVTSECTGITLGGVLNLNDGAVLNDNGHFYYLETDQTELNIAKATFNVGTDFCPDPSSSGVIHWEITSSDASVVVGGSKCDDATSNSKVDITSRSTLNFVTGTDVYFKSVNVTDFEMNAFDADAKIKGTTFYFDKGEFNIASTTPMPNMVLGNANATTMGIKDKELTVRGNLTVMSGSTLKSNNWLMNLQGIFTVNGDFDAGSNTVDFCGEAKQEVDTKVGQEFFNVNITNLSTDGVSFKNNTTIKNELSIAEATKLTGDGAITVQTKYTNTNGEYAGNGGIILHNPNGTLIDVMASGITSNLILDNASGARVTNSNGNNLVISESLTLNNGVLNMKSTTLTLGKNVSTVGGSDFGVNKMIAFESIECGIQKIFNGNETYVELPIGVTAPKYTPAKITVTEINEDASFTITPVNNYHPTIANYTAHPSWLTEGPKQNALSYYWKILSSGTTHFDGNIEFKNHYVDENNTDYHAANKVSGKNHYVSARLLVGKSKWDRAQMSEDTYEKGSIIFEAGSQYFNMNCDDNITGDYTAGLVDNLGTGALPGKILVYVSVKDGDWESPTTWEFAQLDNDGKIKYDDNGDVLTTKQITDENGEVVSVRDGGPEQCAIVFVYHDVKINKDVKYVYYAHIDKKFHLAPGILRLNDTKGHIFSMITGKGMMETTTGTLPQGDYTEFVKADVGGTIIFNGESSYQYPIGRSTFNNVVFTGSGKRELNSDELIVNGYFKADGEQTMSIENPNGATWNIHGDFIYNGGKFVAPQEGLVSIINMCGDKPQSFRPDEGKTPLPLNINILEVNNSSLAGVTVNFPIHIIQHLKFYKGVLNTNYEQPLTIENAIEDHESTVQGYNKDRFVNGPLTKKILTSGSWTFPVGSHLNNASEQDNRLGHFTVYNYNPGDNSGKGYVTVRYLYMPHEFSGDPEKYDDGILNVDRSEYWEVTPKTTTQNANATFGLTLRWDEINLISDDATSLQNVCITNYINDKWHKIDATATPLTALTGNVKSVPTSMSHTPGTQYIYTLAHTGAITFDWTGKEGTDWFNVENWSGHKVPQKSDFVMIGKISTTNYPIIKSGETAEAKFIKLIDNASLTIQSRGALTVFTDVVVSNGSTLTLKAPSGSTDNQHSIPPSGSLIYYGSFSGKATFERYVRNCIFERMAIPVTGFNKNTIVHPAYDIYYANEAFNLDSDKKYYHYTGNLSNNDNPSILKAGWKLFNNPDVNNIDSAYLLCSYEGRARAFSFTGNPMPEIGYGYSRTVNFTSNDKIQNGDPDDDINSLDGWNFIPNPFLSAVDVDKMEFKNVDRTVYVHDNVSDKSFCYQQAAGEQAGYLSDDGTYDLSVIAAGQSFFVHANSNAAGRKGVVTFPKECLTHGNEKTLLKSGNSGSNSVDKIVFNTSGNGGKFQSVVYFREDATSGFDSDYDAYLQASTDAGILNFYSVGPNSFERLMVNGLPTSVKDGGEIPLGYTTSTAGTYTLSVKKFTVNNAKVYLVDTENNTTTELAEGFATKIDVAKGTNNSRFKLVFELLPEPEPEPEPEPVVVEPEPEVVTPEPEVVEPEVVEPVVINNPEVIVPEVNQKNNGELVIGGDEVSEPVTPEPVTPEPVTPEPVIPEPVVPEPVDNNNQGFEPIVPTLVENVDVKVYPVPSNGPVNVELGSLLDETGSVQMILVNASGRVIITKTVYDDTIHLDLSHRAGVYILRLSTPSKTVVKRIIIQ